jgi:hypothetical protein
MATATETIGLRGTIGRIGTTRFFDKSRKTRKMNSKLPYLPLLALALLAGAGGMQRPADARGADEIPTAHQLLKQARQALARHPSVEAKVRQQIDLFDQQLFGSGRYLQQGTGPEMLMRLELKLQVGGRISSLLQVADGRYLWTDRQILKTHTVSRVDVRQVREELGPDARSGAPGGWPLLGGLGEMLAGIAANFEFEPVQTGELGDVPIYTLVGRLRGEELVRRAKALAGDPEQVKPLDPNHLPEQIPGEVLIVLGRDDLFPYLIDYRRAGQSGQGSAGRSLLRMQLFEVRIGGPVDLRQFVYQPGGVAVNDQTQAVIERLRARAGEH